jgi:hypothetical protein
MLVDAIKEFLEVEPQTEGLVYPEKHKVFYYKSEKLKYEILLDLEEKSISISADFEHPFGGRSLYEISVEFDRVLIETEPEFYGNRKILVCRKDYPKAENFKTLMIMKWDSNELSVWPNYYRLVDY